MSASANLGSQQCERGMGFGGAGESARAQEMEREGREERRDGGREGGR